MVHVRVRTAMLGTNAIVMSKRAEQVVVTVMKLEVAKLLVLAVVGMPLGAFCRPCPLRNETSRAIVGSDVSAHARAVDCRLDIFQPMGPNVKHHDWVCFLKAHQNDYMTRVIFLAITCPKFLQTCNKNLTTYR